MMKFNVSHWSNNTWNYIATVVASNEQDAAKTIHSRFGLTGKFASHPHIDCYSGQVTSKTAFTTILSTAQLSKIM